MVNINVNGRLGADAELKATKSGEQFISFRLATNEFNKKTKSNETIWMNVIAFGKKAIVMCPHLKKGSLVNIMGEERVSLFQLKSGEYTINRDILADRVEFISTNSNRSEDNVTTVSETSSFDKPTIEPTVLQPQVSILNTSVASSSEDDLPF